MSMARQTQKQKDWFRTRPTVEAGILLREKSTEGLEFVEYQPGNGARYCLLFQPLVGLTQKALGYVGCGETSYLVALITDPAKRPSMIVNDEGFLAPIYVMEKLGVNEVDGVVLAELIGFVLGRPTCSVDEWIAR